MSNWKEPIVEAMKPGYSYTWTSPDGGYFASMRNAVKHGQTLTMSPVADPAEIQAGDLVLVKWTSGYLFHVVGEVQGNQFLIVNSLGKINGWVDGSAILGKVTEIIDPEPRPTVPVMLEQLNAAYLALIEVDIPSANEVHRLLAIVDDLRWYAERLGQDRTDVMPLNEKWSFEQNLWHLTEQARKLAAPVQDRIGYFIDCGKECVGSASEIYMLLEYGELDER